MPDPRPGARRAPSDMDRRVGACLRAHRRARGMTLEAVAGLLGLSHQQLHKYETGRNRISAGMLHDAASLLDVPVADFFASEGLPQLDQAMRLRQAAYRLVDATPEAQLGKVVKMLRAMRR